MGLLSMEKGQILPPHVEGGPGLWVTKDQKSRLVGWGCMWE
jgi:hypothetical protein